MQDSELYRYLRGNRAVAAVCAMVLLAVPMFVLLGALLILRGLASFGVVPSTRWW